MYNKDMRKSSQKYAKSESLVKILIQILLTVGYEANQIFRNKA